MERFQPWDLEVIQEEDMIHTQGHKPDWDPDDEELGIVHCLCGEFW